MPAAALAKALGPLLEHYWEADVQNEFPFGDFPPECQLAAVLEREGVRIFSPTLSTSAKTLLLQAFLSNGANSKRLADAKGYWVGDLHSRWTRGSSPWDRVSDQIKYRRRYVVDYSSIHPDGLGALLRSQIKRYSKTIARGEAVFRARVHDDESRRRSLRADELAAPPSALAQAGRANSAGIPVLYTANSRATAVAEARPFMGAVVTIGRMIAQRELKLFNLARRSNLRDVDPADPEISSVIKARNIIEEMDQNFSEPVGNYSPARDYAPTQITAEIISSLGFDGIEYRSALRAGGRNYVFFDSQAALATELASFRIAAIRTNFVEYDPADPDGFMRSWGEEPED